MGRFDRVLDDIFPRYRRRRRLNRPILIQSLLEAEQVCLEFLVEDDLVVWSVVVVAGLDCEFIVV